jgi:hypothetical protein
MKNLHLCITVFLVFCFLPTLKSQGTFAGEEKPSYNYGNWISSSSSNIGIGTFSQSTGKLSIKADDKWWDFLRLIPNGQTSIGYWLFHNPANQDKLHIGWHTINPHNEYWNLSLTQDAKVGINVTSPQAQLDVNGTFLVRIGSDNYLSTGDRKVIFGSERFNITAAINGTLYANEIEVSTDSWSDYVFDDEYPLTTLTEVEAFINTNKHLPGVPSEKEVIEEGINLGEMDAVLLKKIEELTLYVIELQKQLEEVKQTAQNN